MMVLSWLLRIITVLFLAIVALGLLSAIVEGLRRDRRGV